MIGLALIALLIPGRLSAAVTGDAQLTGHDLSQKQAYEAAKAGIDQYAYHLHSENGYWAKCTNVQARPAQ